MWWRSTIVLGFSDQVGLLVEKLCRVELVSLGEELPWQGRPLELCTDVLMYLLESIEVLHELWADV